MTLAAFTTRGAVAALDRIGGAGGDAQAPRMATTVKPAACQRTPLSYHDGDVNVDPYDDSLVGDVTDRFVAQEMAF
jgi:hypothetical protein